MKSKNQLLIRNCEICGVSYPAKSFLSSHCKSRKCFIVFMERGYERRKAESNERHD